MTPRTGPALNADGTRCEQRGRRTRLTYEVIAEIASAIQEGAPVQDAICAIARVRPDTARHWMQVGRGEHPFYPKPHARYVDLVREVEEAESNLVSMIAQGLSTDDHWKPRLTMLGALRPQYKEREARAPQSNPILDVATLLRELRPSTEGEGDKQLPAPVVTEVSGAVQGRGEGERSEEDERASEA